MVAGWAAEPSLAVDTSAEDRTSVAASVHAGSAGASSVRPLASSQRAEARIGGTTVGTAVACHGGRRRHSVGANASADPLDVISLSGVANVRDASDSGATAEIA